MILSENSTTYFAQTGRQIGAVFKQIGQRFDALARLIADGKRLEALSSKSDAELADIGLTRQDIPRYVFDQDFDR